MCSTCHSRTGPYTVEMQSVQCTSVLDRPPCETLGRKPGHLFFFFNFFRRSHPLLSSFSPPFPLFLSSSSISFLALFLFRFCLSTSCDIPHRLSNPPPPL